MAIKLGNTDINKIYLGSTEIKKAYLGGLEIFNSSSSFDADYQAVLDRATFLGYSLPDSIQQIVQNQFLIDLKTFNIWNKLDVFYVYATNGDSDFASLNWKNPSVYQSTRINSVSFITNVGYKGNGVDAYVDTNFIPSVDGVNYTLTDAGFGGHFTQDGGSLPYMSTDSLEATIRNFGIPNNNRINTTQHNALPYGINNYDGFQGAYRVDLNTQRVIYGASDLYDNTDTVANVIPSSSFKIFRLNANYSAATSRVAFVGANLSAEHSDFNTIIEAYLSSIA